MSITHLCQVQQSRIKRETNKFFYVQKSMICIETFAIELYFSPKIFQPQIIWFVFPSKLLASCSYMRQSRSYPFVNDGISIECCKNSQISPNKNIILGKNIALMQLNSMTRNWFSVPPETISIQYGGATVQQDGVVTLEEDKMETLVCVTRNIDIASYLNNITLIFV